MTEHIQDIDFPGSGPFAIPLLAKLVSVDKIEKDYLVARCALESGAEVYIPIATLAAAGLLESLKVWRIRHAELEAKDQQKH
jgi:hypothetical protein